MDQKKRECGSCTKCCEGWLAGEAHGYKFWPGMPCHFKMNGGCSIYKDRPDDPCKTYQCEWLVNDKIPYWMKPDQINAIITERESNGIKFLDVMEAGEKLKVDVLNWLFIHSLSYGTNIAYRINGALNKVGSVDFTSMDIEKK